MALENFKITDQQMHDNGMASAPDVLTGTAGENKRRFDQMVREVVIVSINNLIKLLQDPAAASELGFKGVDGLEADTLQEAAEQLLGKINDLQDSKVGKLTDGTPGNLTVIGEGGVVADAGTSLDEHKAEIDAAVKAATDAAESAEESKKSADKSATDASDSAKSASGSAATATTKAGAAETSAKSASGSAATATTKAGAAATSAANAKAAETNAKGYKDTALGYRNEAETFKNAAAASAGNADESARAAKEEADRAERIADPEKLIANKLDKVSGAVKGNVPLFDENGQLMDSGRGADELGGGIVYVEASYSDFCDSAGDPDYTKMRYLALEIAPAVETNKQVVLKLQLDQYAGKVVLVPLVAWESHEYEFVLGINVTDYYFRFSAAATLPDAGLCIEASISTSDGITNAFGGCQVREFFSGVSTSYKANQVQEGMSDVAVLSSAYLSTKVKSVFAYMEIPVHADPARSTALRLEAYCGGKYICGVRVPGALSHVKNNVVFFYVYPFYGRWRAEAYLAEREPNAAATDEYMQTNISAVNIQSYPKAVTDFPYIDEIRATSYGATHETMPVYIPVGAGLKVFGAIGENR